MKPWTYDGLTYRRRPTRTVHVGAVAVGSDHPIRVQSMTTPATTDVAATVGQIVRLVEAGCEIVRVTVPKSGDAEALPVIRRELQARGLDVPLVADIHFTPAVAMKAVEHVDKIRVNPGNFADKKKFAVREYSETQYDGELERIAAIFSPLVLRAQERGVSMRIGTNHGSLSDRIMNRYGDTPEGMVESALEFVRICESHDYRELILSMKASNPRVVLHAYRLLCERMAAEDMHYPIHLGVTEAGDGEDGRIKSATGIGTLLDEGIGDTVRVSLTEDPVAEIPVARALVAPYDRRAQSADSRPFTMEKSGTTGELRDPHAYARRPSGVVRCGPIEIGGSNPVRVEVPLRTDLGDARGLRRELDGEVGVRVLEETRAELVSVSLTSADQIEALHTLRRSMELVAPRVALSARIESSWVDGGEDRLDTWLAAAHRLHLAIEAPLDAQARRRIAELLARAGQSSSCLLLEARSSSGDPEEAVRLAEELSGLEPPGEATLMLALAPSSGYSPLHAMRRLIARLAATGKDTPVVLLDRPADRGADPLIGPASALGGLLCDGTGDAIQIHVDPVGESRRRAFGILQSARVRITRTEFISCPSCGRTLFDLEETTARIKSRTSHLKGLKIAVMGCIVNGPGEMADADFGYVGWGEDKIALFVGKEMVSKDIPTHDADERLVDLIKQHGRWVEPPVSV